MQLLTRSTFTETRRKEMIFLKGSLLNKEPVVGIDKKIPGIEKFFFSSAPGIGTFYFMMASTWLLFFYTDVLKIDVLYVGAMFVVIRVIDAIITPIFGMYLDRQETRWGKYKPWLFILWTGMCVGGFFTFNAVNLGQTGNTIYATITYAVFSIFISMSNGPILGMTTVITKRQDDRLAIGTGSAVWILVFGMIAYIAVLPLINAFGNGDQRVGFRVLMLVLLVINMVMTIIIVKLSKERFMIPKEQLQKFSLKQVFKSLRGNKYAVIAFVYTFVLTLSGSIRSAVGIYYYKYYFNDENMLVLAGMIAMIPMLVGAFVGALFAKKVGLRATILTAIIVSAATSVPMYFLPANDTGKMIFLVLSAIGGLFSGMAQPSQSAMTPVAADYSEWKFKTNSGGFFGTLNGFFQTLSTAVAGGVVSFILVAVNYVPDVQQTTTSLNGIRFMMALLPAITILIGLVMIRWDMTDKKHKEIVEEVNLRRASEADGNVAANMKEVDYAAN
jgi:sugar (glycoside-pentoside-hexuronide) transporter